MGNDEAIIYGDRHGEPYREFEYEDDRHPQGNVKSATAEQYFFPNAVRLNSLGHIVSIGIQQYDQETGKPRQSEHPDDYTSMWTDLDRNGINRLIKELRRMRDRVYGKDE